MQESCKMFSGVILPHDTTLTGKIDRWFWAEFSAHISSICAEKLKHGTPILHCTRSFRYFSTYFPLKMVPHPCVSAHISGIRVEFGWKSSSMVPHLPFFWPHAYGFQLFSTNFALFLSCRVHSYLGYWSPAGNWLHFNWANQSETVLFLSAAALRLIRSLYEASARTVEVGRVAADSFFPALDVSV